MKIGALNTLQRPLSHTTHKKKKTKAENLWPRGVVKSFKLTFNCDFLFPTTLKKSTLHVHGSLMDGERHGTIQEDACKSDLTKRRYALRIEEA